MRGITFGLDGELVFLGNYSKGWSELKIPKKFKTKENFETYCYLRYLGIDAEIAFQDKIREISSVVE